MYIRLKPSIRWPERRELCKTMPIDYFKAHFKNHVVIINCFKEFCEYPQSLWKLHVHVYIAQTYSDYKHHNTVKLLIGVAPQDV